MPFSAGLQIHLYGNHGRRESLTEISGVLRSSFYLKSSISATGVMLATATYFNNPRFLGLLAVFATILAIGLGRAVAGGMRTFIFLVLCHKKYLAFW